MKRHFQFLLIVATLFFTFQSTLLAQDSKDITAVKSILARQEADWNAGKIDDFMNGYWQSEKLKFIGASGITYGYDATLRNYHKRYPDRTTMGKLKFEVISTEKLSRKVIMLVGNWDLQRASGDIGGIFTLIFKKINREWVVASDHTSVRP